MTRWLQRGLLRCLLWLGWPLTALAMPQLAMEVSLDPATRQFQATATLSDARGLTGFALGPDFEITAMTINGKPAQPDRRLASADFRPNFRLPADSRTVTLHYRATLKPTPALDHRQVLGNRAATAAPDGSFLPGAAGWYPDAGRFFSYRLTLQLPAGQKGLVPGNLVEENDRPAGYRATFEVTHPADGIDLMAGPYAVQEKALTLGSRQIRLRTWFHAELASHAPGYLDDSARYIERYSKLIGDYPFTIFSIVSSPTPTGFGMPSLTYLGRDVIKLPFIRATSLGHEVLHNWWGNGVYPDWQKGNWSEGLTTFLADYAYKEDEGETAAREMRLGWLRDYAAVPPGADIALKDFTSRHHGIASIVGYNKAAMVFLMLRDRIGRDAFERGLRLLWQRKQFQTASWDDLEAAFSAAAGQSQADFFRQWIQRPGNPAFTPQQIAADADFRLWRRIDPALFPPILREVFVAPRTSLLIIDAQLDAPARALAGRLLDARPTVSSAERPGEPTLVIGLTASVDAWLASRKLQRPFPPHGTAQVWAARAANNTPLVVISVRDAEALGALQRGLPHYGKQNWLVFDGPRASDKGVLPPQP